VYGALPAMPAPHSLSRTSRVSSAGSSLTGPGRYVCGDHRTTGSVQGAMASGTRAAREFLADAGGRSAAGDL
jgi:predicted NAD/FAD-dependent oxidoreductase